MKKAVGGTVRPASVILILCLYRCQSLQYGNWLLSALNCSGRQPNLISIELFDYD